jgi:hypothetical protein
MDLATLDASTEGAIMTVRHPATDEVLLDDKGNPITITLVGIDHPTYRKAQRQALDRRLAKGNRSKLTAAGIEEDSIDVAVRCTTAWSGITVDGKALPCSAENARTVYKRLPWLFEQVDKFVGDRANFLKA